MRNELRGRANGDSPLRRPAVPADTVPIGIAADYQEAFFPRPGYTSYFICHIFKRINYPLRVYNIIRIWEYSELEHSRV